MLCFISPPDPRSFQNSGDFNPLRLTPPHSQPGRERLRHIIIGSPAGVQATIKTLQVLNYADQATWSRLLEVPDSGIVITPEQGEVFSYLLRYRQLE
jgi:hypothetical protein